MSQGCVILAAGEGRRMGTKNKALLLWQGQSFLARIASLCKDIGVGEIVVVVAEPHATATEIAARELGLACVRNAHPEIGMAGSVALGFAHALEHFASETCWLWPVDAPAMGRETLDALAAHAHIGRITTPRFAGRGGHPSLVGRDIWPELARCDGEPEGARTVFRRGAERRCYVDVGDAAVCHDVDRPEDLLGGAI